MKPSQLLLDIATQAERLPLPAWPLPPAGVVVPAWGSGSRSQPCAACKAEGEFRHLYIAPRWVDSAGSRRRAALPANEELACDNDGYWLFDLTNPATLGCIEHELLPEAWGTPGVSLSYDGVTWAVFVDGEKVSEEYTKGEALVCALEAAPQ